MFISLKVLAITFLHQNHFRYCFKTDYKRGCVRERNVKRGKEKQELWRTLPELYYAH